MRNIRGIMDRAMAQAIWRGSRVKTAVDNNAYRNCGICPGSIKLLADANRLEGEKTMEEPDLTEDSTDQDQTNWQKANGKWYRKVYTDGSALRPECRETARAGWGVFYGKNSHRNKAESLMGSVQNSYRAEVRAALCAVAGAKEPTMVIIDCKAVVGIIDKLLQKRGLPKGIADRDLWEKIAYLLEGHEEQYQVRWMPSHLDEPDKQDKRNEAIEQGVVDEHDIQSNAEADELAKKGANGHLCFDAHEAAAQQDIAEITRHAHFMMVKIWDKYCNEHGKNKGEELDEVLANLGGHERSYDYPC